MKPLIKLLLLLSLLLPLTGFSAEEQSPGLKSIAKPGETFSLKYQFKKDGIKSVVSDATMVIKNQIGPMSMPMSMKMQTVCSVKTSSIDENGAAALALTMDSMNGEIEILGQKQPMPKQMPQDQAVSITVNPTGEWLSGMESLNSSMLSPSGPGVTLMLQSLFILLPEKEVAVGESWKKELDVDFPGSQQKMKETIETSLKDVVEMDGQKVAIITMKSERTGKDIELDAKALASQGIPMPFQDGKITIPETSQSKNVEAFFNLDSGSVIKVIETSKMMTSMSGFGSAQAITMNMDGDTILTVSSK